MRMIGIRRVFASMGTGLIALITATTPSAQAAQTPAAPPAASVCATGHRGQTAYDQQCLTVATLTTGAVTWYAGRNPAYPITPDHRRILCGHAKRIGMAVVVHGVYGEVLSETYVNNGQAERWTAAVGRGECGALGFRNIR